MNTLKHSLLLAGAFGALSSLVGCGGYTRTPSQWTEDTYKLLETKNESIQKCYNSELKKNPGLEGMVTVDFHVDNRTGRVRKVKIDKQKTTAGDPVRKCVTTAIQDLKLTPPDANDGQAKFQWEFKANVAPADPPPAS